VTLRFSPAHDRERGHLDRHAYLVDADGKYHFYSGERYPRALRNGVVYVGFDIPARQAVAVIYRYRPGARREIQNVSLVPGQQTTPVEAEAPPFPSR
jgi:hypothetical protein